MKMIDHNHFICHLILGTFTEYPLYRKKSPVFALHALHKQISFLLYSNSHLFHQEAGIHVLCYSLP